MRRSVLVTLVVGTALFVGCSSSTKTTTRRTTVWPAACQTVRDTFANSIRSGADAANSSRDSLNHWTDVWNSVTGGRSAQYEALMTEMRKDGDAATAAYALQRQHFATLSNVYARCNQARIPAACVTELKLMMTMAQHEVQASQASTDAFKGGAEQSAAWNAQPRNIAAVNAATAHYNAARDRMSALSKEHNQLLDQYNASADACNKAVEAA